MQLSEINRLGYVKNFQYLAEEVARRKADRTDIRKKIDAYVLKHYGIEDYSDLADSHLGQSDELTVCLCRQVATGNIEHAAVQVFTDWLIASGLRAHSGYLSFERDSFSYENGYKKSLVKIPWLKRRSKAEERLYVENEKILSKQAGDISGWILADIRTKDGVRLVDYHENARNCFLPRASHHRDVSELFETCLRQSLEKKGLAPKFFYIVDGGREQKIAWLGQSDGNRIRPPASWFYHLHLLSFLDGQRALISQIGDCPKIANYFNEPTERIRRDIGLEPLVIDTPVEVKVGDYQGSLNEINPALKKYEGDVIDRLDSQNLFFAMQEIEKELISWR